MTGIRPQSLNLWRISARRVDLPSDIESHQSACEGGKKMLSPSRASVRILTVDDYEPFRRFLRLKLQERPELQIIGEASDGLQAVHKAQELQPDLILLDIGLPTLNGIDRKSVV